MLLPFAWQKDCVISDKVRKAPEATPPPHPSLLSLRFPQYFLPTVHPTSPHLSPLLLGKHGVSALQGHRLLHLSCQWRRCWGGMLCTVCLGGAEGGVLQRPGMWAGAGGHLHFSHLCLTTEIPFPNTLLPASL